MPHQHILAIEPLVEYVRLLSLKFKPHCAMRALYVQPLELLSCLRIGDVQLAEYASIATSLERLVEDIVEAGSEHLRPPGTSLVAACKGQA
jgi:hypothetical protein